MAPVRHDVIFYEPFSLIGLEITLLEVTHPPLEESSAVLITDGLAKVVITGDTSRNIPKKSLQFMFKPDLLIADAIIPPRGNIPKHMNSKKQQNLEGH